MGAPQTLDGWYVYHDFRKVRYDVWKNTPQPNSVLRTYAEFAESQYALQRDRKGSFGQFVIAGHKADVLFLYMRPSLEELNEVKAAFAATPMADLTESTYSYISVVELGGYLAKPGVDIEQDEAIQARLKPTMPSHRHICFYPMNKRRMNPDNWYMLDEDERRKFLQAHGAIGRRYAGIVKQIICGSIGLDDWEWGVTLFADDPLQFKKLVHEMRFDESSARFAEFGPFYVGHQVDTDGLWRWLMSSRG
ncbi:Chlorite dismutase [Alicyclobacillus hesperidum URH17-3-68]|uniref:Coproheme decarboxylase n=1 Tax=Alicyclobacillus hesperidum TaxID=89784 RepID=A0A1H2T3J9_9BACL|nr:hydrogen peroxide-dependent heme synthase [Alicyclobacillus hesperidum]EJY56377.1 Chlorite dismutase [Alicyclobacillus hesperidum URH17-3-68]GLV13737.1 putative heme-dependent peroxidase YwfI [Alicyclobacillus hesperidum]SDW38285.1 chlorite dismutase [Alicyclobacillus hesperidum]